MVYSLQSTKAPGKFTLVRTNFGFSSGVHYFEINCLSSCANLSRIYIYIYIEFGLIQGEGQHFGRECMVQFRTTTPRVVGMELDLRLLQLNFWLNGREQKSKTLKLDPGYWIPAIYIQGIGNSVVLNPFVSAPNNQYSYVFNNIYIYIYIGPTTFGIHKPAIKICTSFLNPNIVPRSVNQGYRETKGEIRSRAPPRH